MNKTTESQPARLSFRPRGPALGLLCGLALLCVPLSARPAPADDQAFVALMVTLTSEYAKRYPIEATELGIHSYDGEIDDVSPAGIAAELAWLRDWQARLAAIPLASLSTENRFDLELARHAVGSRLYLRSEAQDHRRRPGTYLRMVAGSVNALIKRSFAPAQQRLRLVQARLAKLPSALQAAEKNLDASAPLSQVAIDITLSDLDATARFLSDDVPLAFPEVKDAALQQELRQASSTVAQALRRFGDFLKQRRKTASPAFSLGSEAYKKRLWAVEMIDEPLPQLLSRAESEIARLQREFRATAGKIDSKKDAAAVQLDMLKDHPSGDRVIAETSARLSGQQKFLIDRRIVTLPSPVLPLVRETPPFMRATTLASMDTPGPYDSAKEAYYYVTLPNPTWTKEQAEDFLRGAHSRPIIEVTAIHEAFPGHYLQHLWEGRLSKARQLFGVMSNIEGWAHYTEQMMLDEGYGNGDPTLRLAQIQDALLRAGRFVAALRMHTDAAGPGSAAWTVEQATDYFQKQALQTRKVSEMEALRGTQDPLYMVYTWGKLEILRLRDEVKAARGAGFALKGFHDDLLSYGRAPFRLIRPLVVKK
ncbi:MAG: DUF885 domain-containing protein [Myxococcales bacterium]|nr:DUF885 domain-containing protein [Myxococcales bacterium]